MLLVDDVLPRPSLAAKVTRSARPWTAAVLGASLLLGCGPDPGPGAALYVGCIPCHGYDAAGNQDLGAPAIAGQNLWYIERQLQMFRTSIRGVHPDDLSGQRMAPMAQLLGTDADVKTVAAHIAAMPRNRPDPVLTGGRPEIGRTLYQVCLACHGSDGAGMPGLSSPSLTRTNDWYLLAALKKFKAGHRGANPEDVIGATMRPQAVALPDEQAMLDVISYIQTLRE